jgi:hypothetical protein
MQLRVMPIINIFQLMSVIDAINNVADGTVYPPLYEEWILSISNADFDSTNF